MNQPSLLHYSLKEKEKKQNPLILLAFSVLKITCFLRKLFSRSLTSQISPKNFAAFPSAMLLSFLVSSASQTCHPSHHTTASTPSHTDNVLLFPRKILILKCDIFCFLCQGCCGPFPPMAALCPDTLSAFVSLRHEPDICPLGRSTSAYYFDSDLLFDRICSELMIGIVWTFSPDSFAVSTTKMYFSRVKSFPQQSPVM